MRVSLGRVIDMSQQRRLASFTHHSEAHLRTEGIRQQRRVMGVFACVVGAGVLAAVMLVGSAISHISCLAGLERRQAPGELLLHRRPREKLHPSPKSGVVPGERRAGKRILSGTTPGAAKRETVSR